jgi:hypothetical protein
MKHQGMRMYGRMEGQFGTFLNATLHSIHCKVNPDINTGMNTLACEVAVTDHFSRASLTP